MIIQPMEREIIEINEELCVGCGNCVPNCHQGALQIIDGKARLLSDLMCEGLGACVGHCPTGAMTVQKREAEPYDEAKVLEKCLLGGENVLRAHLNHLIQHRQTKYLHEAREILATKGILMESILQHPSEPPKPEQSVTHRGMDHSHSGAGCPGSQARALHSSNSHQTNHGQDVGHQNSQLRQWPVQLHLLNPQAEYFQRADLLLAADCTAFASGNFHDQFLKGKTLAIACPKLDHNLDSYVSKLVALVEESEINTLTVLIMEVPCCGGLVQLASQALEIAHRKIPMKVVVLSLEGHIKHERWIMPGSG
jgi:NAD-dependent dihydropyrimidine dehydrogenase PreA subunit